MKKTIAGLLSIILITAMLASNSFAAAFETGWTADLSKTDLWMTEGIADEGVNFVSLSSPAAERYVVATKVGTLGGFKAKIIGNNDTPWKAIAIQITIDLDKTQYLHIKHSEVNTVYCVKVTKEQQPTDGVDLVLLAEGSAKGQELVTDIKTKTGWSGKQTFWIKYFMIDPEKVELDNVVDLFCITSSMAFVAAPVSSSVSSSKTSSASAISSKAVSEAASTAASASESVAASSEAASVSDTDSITSDESGAVSDTDESNTEEPVEDGLSGGTIALIVVAVLAAAGAAAFFIFKKKK